MVAAAIAVVATAARDQPSAASLSAPEVEAQVEALLGRMTLDEKIGQLNLASNNPRFDFGEVASGQVGGVLAFVEGRAIGEVQGLARSSRLGIPLLVGLDVLHGLRTMFPLPLAQTASFEPGLAREAARLAAAEAAAMGINWTFAPVADLARDPRWGRAVEGFGEDPFLGRTFVRAQVEGYLAGGVLPTLKHFAGYGAARGGRDYDGAEIPDRDLFDSYLPPFRAGIEAGAPSVMSGFHALNGEPASASRRLQTEILRGALGFRGFVVSDWTAIPELIAHGVAADPVAAARRAFAAGIDMDMASGLYRRHFADEVRAGRIPEADITEAARRVLRAKVASGLFEAPATPALLGRPPEPSDAARAAARRMAAATAVLLRNEGALPLAGQGRIALIGGLAASGRDLAGPHAALVRHEDTVAIVDGLRARAAAAGRELVYRAGCDPACRDATGFDEAVAAAREAETVIAVLGEPLELVGESSSRAHLALPGRQGELLDRLIATGKPVILVLVAARPLGIAPERLSRLAAVLMAWYPGTEGGNAVADLLFGDVAPAAKLPMTWPRSVGQIPLTYDERPTGRPADPADPTSPYQLRYMDEELTPLFPFGFGLTYTSFALRDLEILTSRVSPDELVRARVRLTNTGTRPGQEVVQLYARQPVGRLSRPLRQLKAFAKVALEPGESRVVEFAVAARDLGYAAADGSQVLEPGLFEFHVGASAATTLSGRFEVVAP